MRKLATLAAVVTATTFGLASMANAAGPTYSFDGDLMGYWSFDDQANPTNDDSGNGNTGLLNCEGTCTDPVFDTGVLAPFAADVASILYDGVDDTVEIADDDILTPTGAAVTIAA